MGKKTLSIDISDGRIALLLLDQTGRGASACGHVVELQPEPRDPETLARAAADAVAREGLEFDRCVLVLDSAQALYRDYILPFSSRPQLEATLSYELDEDLPLDMSQAVYDFTRIRQQGRSSRICAAVFQRRVVAELLDALAAHGLDPQRAEPEACAMAAAAVLGRKQFPDKALLVELGRTRSLLVFLDKGRVASVRVLDRCEQSLLAPGDGGLDQDALRRALTFTDFSSPVEEGSAAEAIRAGLEDTADEVDRFTALYEETDGPWPGPVFVCGELASVKGLREILMDRLGREVSILAESRDVREAFGMHEAIELNSLVTALGAGLPDKADGRMNLRRGDLAPAAGGGSLGRVAAYVASLAAVVLLCWGLLTAVQIRRDAKALEAYNEAIGATFTQAVPGLTGDFNKTQQVSILKGRIASLRNAAKGDAADPAPSFLEDFQAIHAAVNASLDVVLDRLNRDSMRTALEGTADTFQSVEALRTALTSSGRFGHVDIKGASADKKTGRVRFEMELTR